MKILVTGAAGFIGHALSQKLLQQENDVVGIDNLNEYYDVQLKKDRLSGLKYFKHFHFHKVDIADKEGLLSLFEKNNFDCVVNLAAQAGVRYSLENPHAYIDSNIVGFINVLEGCRHFALKHLVFASSSSVYGGNTKLPFAEEDNVDHPLSLYAATKKSNELMAHSYAHLYHLPVTGLRFFTVYGPWGRPDMALFKFVSAMMAEKPLPLFNEGKMIRDFTYIDDVVEGIIRVLHTPAQKNPDWRKSPHPASSEAPYAIYNIGHNQPIELLRFIQAIEKAMGKKANFEYLPMQAGDVVATHASVNRLHQQFDYVPKTSVEEGIGHFVSWYKAYYGKRAK